MDKLIDINNLPLLEKVCDNIYYRTITMPKGNIIVGHKHKHKTMNVMVSGKMRLWMNGVIEEIEAPCIFESEPNSRKIGFILEDVIFMNVHNITGMDVNNLKDELLVKEDIEKELFNNIRKELEWLGYQ